MSFDEDHCRMRVDNSGENFAVLRHIATNFYKSFTSVKLRQHRTKIVPQMRCQIFRQIVQKFRRHTDVCRGIFVHDDGKYASRCGAKPQGGLCAVLP